MKEKTTRLFDDIKHIFLLFFIPNRLKLVCAERYVNGVRNQHPDYYERNPETCYREGYRQYSKSIDEVRRNIFKAFFRTVIAISIVIAIYIYVSDNYPALNIYGKFIGPCVMFWAVNGRTGDSIQTIAGGSIPETINLIWFRLLSFVGLVITLISFLS